MRKEIPCRRFMFFLGGEGLPRVAKTARNGYCFRGPTAVHETSGWKKAMLILISRQSCLVQVDPCRHAQEMHGTATPSRKARERTLVETSVRSFGTLGLGNSEVITLPL